jgi:predicted AlkP superfamily pyrophosphatase or phosphodiesterase
MFWWYNMYSTADWFATPRPMYPADGRKIPDHYTQPVDLHDELDTKLGQFPLFKFWGPMADITSTDWIAKATLHVMETRNPTLTLSYLPHLDYNLQRLGPDLGHPRLQADLGEIDALCGMMIDAAEARGRRVIVVSEYGITQARGAIHINRALREAGLVAVLDGVESVWGAEEKRAHGLDHPRSGELVAVAAADRWFSYYYWLEADRAPDFARTVDIHRKPGYDPVELFMDPALRAPKLAAGWKLAKRKLGFRQLLDVISDSETRLVKGTHGRLTDDPADGPLVISSEPGLLPEGAVRAVDFKGLVLEHVFGRM